MASIHKDNSYSTRHTAVANVTIKATPGTVHKLICSSSNGATSSGDIILRNDTTAVIVIPSGTPMPWAFPVGIHFSTNIKLELANADEDVTIAWT